MSGDRKFLLAPSMRGDVIMLSRDVEALSGTSVRDLAAMRRRGQGPRWERYGRFYAYRPSAVIEWLNELAAAEKSAGHVG